jgi:quercetin dioxygenase-like cupin family protein
LPTLVPSSESTAVWYIDMPPESASPMHRTVSLDVVIQIVGEVELTLESGETRIIKPGDVTVQRSTMHMWRNPSATEWTRMIGIMVECKPVEVGGKTLGMSFPSPS